MENPAGSESISFSTVDIGSESLSGGDSGIIQEETRSIIRGREFPGHETIVENIR